MCVYVCVHLEGRETENSHPLTDLLTQKPAIVRTGPRMKLGVRNAIQVSPRDGKNPII